MMMVRTCIKTTLFLQGTHIYIERWSAKSRNTKGTLFLLHGFLSSSHSFYKLIPYLPKQYELICIDLPGYGQSGKTKNFQYAFKTYSSMIAEIIRLYHLKGVTIIGHSMGGQIGLRLAKDYPELIHSLILLAPSAYFHRVKIPVYVASYMPFLHSILYSWGKNQDCRGFIEQMIYSKQSLTEEMLLHYSRPLKDPSFYDALMRLIRQREGDMDKTELETILQRVCIIWGNDDPLIPVSTAYTLQNDLPNALLSVLNQTGHLIPEEQPKVTARHIKRFLT